MNDYRLSLYGLIFTLLLDQSIRSASTRTCVMGEKLSGRECELVQPGYVSNDLNYSEPLPCPWSEYPGAAYCDTDTSLFCLEGQFVNSVRTCEDVPSGYFNPHVKFYGVFYKCPKGQYSPSKSSRCFTSIITYHTTDKEELLNLNLKSSSSSSSMNKRDYEVGPCPVSTPTKPESTGAVVSGGRDCNWYIESVPFGEVLTSPVPTQAYFVVILNEYWKVTTQASWIAPRASEESFVDVPGLYNYQTTFTISGHTDYNCFYLPFNFTADDILSSIRINDIEVYYCPPGVACSHYSNLYTYTIATGFGSTNTLNFIVNNTGITLNPTGLLVAFGKLSGCNCPAGQYNYGAESCQNCPAGQYQNMEGLSTCNMCPAGTSSSSGATICQLPSSTPTISPSLVPSLSSTAYPTFTPSNLPITLPSAVPSSIPSNFPSLEPSIEPSILPSSIPFLQPSLSSPVLDSSSNPSISTTRTPTNSNTPQSIPISLPPESSFYPSIIPSIYPSLKPNINPILSPSPSLLPSEIPNVLPSLPSSPQISTLSPLLQTSSPNSPSYSPNSINMMSSVPSISLTPTEIPSSSISISPVPPSISMSNTPVCDPLSSYTPSQMVVRNNTSSPSENLSRESGFFLGLSPAEFLGLVFSLALICCLLVVGAVRYRSMKESQEASRVLRNWINTDAGGEVEVAATMRPRVITWTRNKSIAIPGIENPLFLKNKN